MTDTDLERALRAAEAAADAARTEILSRFRRVGAETKRDGTLVTEADRAAERAIRASLERSTPEIAIFGEEYGGTQEGERYWSVDPIDGTISFTRGLPLFGTLIALVEAGEPTVGLIDLPALGERVMGARGRGVTRNGEPVRVSGEKELGAALVACGDAYTFDLFDARPALQRLIEEVPKLRAYTDAFGHAQVICGGVDAMVDLGLKPWDVAATQLLVREAGGRCITLDRRDRFDYGLGLIFGSPALVEQLAEWVP